MGLKANVYKCSEFIGCISNLEFGSVLWDSITNRLQYSTALHFKRTIETIIIANTGIGCLKPHSGIPDWDIELSWYPTKPGNTGSYLDWTGNILCRTWDKRLTYKEFGESFWQVPSHFMTIKEFEAVHENESRFENYKRQHGL